MTFGLPQASAPAPAQQPAQVAPAGSYVWNPSGAPSPTVTPFGIPMTNPGIVIPNGTTPQQWEAAHPDLSGGELINRAGAYAPAVALAIMTGGMGAGLAAGMGSAAAGYGTAGAVTGAMGNPNHPLQGALMGGVSGALGGSGLAKSATGSLVNAGLNPTLAGSATRAGIGAGMGALGGALNGTGAGTGALQGATSGGISGLISGGLGSAGVNPGVANALTGVGTGLLMNQLYDPHLIVSPTNNLGTGSPAVPAAPASAPHTMSNAGLLNVAANHTYPLTSGLMGAVAPTQSQTQQAPQAIGGQMPAGVPNYSQIAYQNAGSPHYGPYAQTAAPSGVGVPGAAPQSSGGSNIGQTLLGGLLGVVAQNPSILKSLGGALGGLLGTSGGNTIGQPVFQNGQGDPFAGTNLASTPSAIANYNSQPIDLSSLYGSSFTNSPSISTGYDNYAGLAGMTMPSYNFGP